MAHVVRPLVELRDIHVVAIGEQGPPGAMGPMGPSGVGEAPTFSVLNATGYNLPRGTPVGLDQYGALVRADGVTNVKAIGLIQPEVLNNNTYGLVQTGGQIDATALEWAAVTGEVGGLVFGARYFLSPTPGGLTRNPVGVTAVAPIGRASSTTRLAIDIEPLIYL